MESLLDPPREAENYFLSSSALLEEVLSSETRVQSDIPR